MLTLRELIEGIDTAKLVENDAKMLRATLPVSDTVPLSSTKPTSFIVPPKGMFLCFSLTGSFTTLDAGPVDNGLCKLSMKMRNGSGRVYIPDLLSLDLLLTPGRVKDPSVGGAAASNQMQFPGIPFATVFRGNDTLSFDVQNSAAIANTWSLAFHGIWLLG